MYKDNSARSIDVLLVEDNPGDVRLTKEALKDAKFFTNLFIARDGVEAMEFLTKQGKFSEARKPDLILLDLNLPKKDGWEVLQEIKESPELKNIPVVIMTTSSADENIVRSYNLHANCYVSKPLDIKDFVKIIHSIENFWFSVVKLPDRDSSAGMS